MKKKTSTTTTTQTKQTNKNKRCCYDASNSVVLTIFNLRPCSLLNSAALFLSTAED